MLAILAGDASLLIGLLLLLLPLVATELSRPSDAVLGALVLVLGVILITSHDRFIGSPMLAVLSGALLIGRLGIEVGQSRWNQLSNEEQTRFFSWGRWFSRFQELVATIFKFGEILVEQLKPPFLKPKINTREKKWVREESLSVKEKSSQQQTAISAPSKVDNLKGPLMSSDSSSESEGNTSQGP